MPLKNKNTDLKSSTSIKYWQRSYARVSEISQRKWRTVSRSKVALFW